MAIDARGVDAELDANLLAGMPLMSSIHVAQGYSKPTDNYSFAGRGGSHIGHSGGAQRVVQHLQD